MRRKHANLTIFELDLVHIDNGFAFLQRVVGIRFLSSIAPSLQPSDPPLVQSLVIEAKHRVLSGRGRGRSVHLDDLYPLRCSFEYHENVEISAYQHVSEKNPTFLVAWDPKFEMGHCKWICVSIAIVCHCSGHLSPFKTAFFCNRIQVRVG